MIGTLISLGLGCYALGKVGEENTIMMRNKQEARANGCPYYKDARGKYWATYTGEQCYYGVCSSMHNGHDVIYGMKTMTVYKDFTQDKIDEQNREFARQGKPFRLKEYTEVHDKSQRKATWKSTFWLYDLQKGQPYKITQYYNPMDPEHRFIKTYLKPEFGGMFENLGIEREYMTFEEAQKWRP